MTRQQTIRATVFAAAAALLLVACQGGQATLAPGAPTGSPAATPAATFTLSGVVFENVAGTKQAIADAGIYIWGVPCVVGRGFCTTWYSSVNGSVLSDADGRYVAPDVPARNVSIIAGKSGYVQPCAATGGAQQADVQVELASVASFNTATPPPLLTSGVRVRGTVFEMTADGPRGVPGAYISVETLPDLVVASTMTDLTGHFTMCNVGGTLYVGKSRYVESAGVSPSDGMAVELTRQ
jgi:hypothetical protein